MGDAVVACFTLNGRGVRVATAPDRSLLCILREDFMLTGTKRGCEEGVCGVCTVIVDGMAKHACRVMPHQIQGTTVTTIEGLAPPNQLGAIQSAFIEEGAVGCGFCTPGMVMAAQALLSSNPCPSEEEIKGALQPILCRCTGYWAVVRAVQRASGQSFKRSYRILGSTKPLRVVGRNARKLDARDKVTGTALFADDMTLPDLVYATTVRSPHPSARIQGIDASSALQIPGVLAVLTARDIPGRNAFGKTVQDQPILAEDIVAYRGQPVALVAAQSLEVARVAAEIVRVNYDLLPAVLTVEDSPPPRRRRQVMNTLKITRGDVERGFGDASVIVEETFRTHRTEPLFLEPPAGVGMIDPEGRVVLHVACQDPYGIRRQICAALSVGEDRIRIIQPVCGGAFGGKVEASLQIHLALLVWKLRHNVKMAYTRSETFLATAKRHPMTLNYRAGADVSGRLTAMRVRVVADTGAFETSGKAVLFNACHHAAGPYKVANLDVEGYLCRTNSTPCGAQRGFGVPQVAFGHEAVMDILASKLGISPGEIRGRNLVGRGSELASGQCLEGSVPARELLRAVDSGPSAESHQYGRGSGLAVAFKSVGYGGGRENVAQVVVEIDAQGHVIVRTGGVEMGQGSQTIMTQIAAEELGIDPELVSVREVDTQDDIDSGSTEGSRLTISTGKALSIAASDLREALLVGAARVMGIDRSSIRFDSDRFVGNQGGVSLSFSEAAAGCHRLGIALKAKGKASLPVPGSSIDSTGRVISAVDVTFCAARADVEVDIRTGKVKVNSIVYAQDVGRAINPLNVCGQIDGGVVMGLGLALTEECSTEGASQRRQKLAEYLAPRFRDAPRLEEVILEEPGGIGPYGAKGIGELPTIPVAAAIANAIYDAVGVRVRELPIRRVVLGERDGVGDAASSPR